MIADTINQQIVDALKNGDSLGVSTLRLLSNSLRNEEIAEQKSLAEKEELVIVRRELKRREEVIEEIGSKEFGEVMGAVMARVGGRADGSVVANVVRERLG